MSDPIITIQQGRGVWQGPQSEAPRCRKCGAAMSSGIALAQTYTGSPDDLGGDIVTMSPGGPGDVVPCRKCPQCGWSVTGAAPQEAEPVAWMLEDQIMVGDISVTTDPDRAKRLSENRYDGKATWRVTPLYTHPAPAPAGPVWGAPDRIWAWEGDGQDGWDNAYATTHHVANDQVEYVRADIALRAQPAPQVKALNWGEPSANGYITGRMEDREYTVNLAADGESWSVATRVYAFAVNLTWSNVGTGFKSLVEAKAAAQADYNRRILSALSGEAHG